MSSEKNAAPAPDSAAEPLEPHVVAPALRQSLQRCYEHAAKLMAQEKYDHDYVNTLLTECVVKDPNNLVYVEAFLDNQQAKHHNNKRGSRLMGLGGGKGNVKKAASKKDWAEVLRIGPEQLKSNPWDVPTLRAMAQACEAYAYNEVELRYLKNALDANPKDIDVNRHCAISLARMGQFDQAIACWHRIEEHKSGHAEAVEMISRLTIERARDRSGLAQNEPARSPAAARLPVTRPSQAAPAKPAATKATTKPAGASAEASTDEETTEAPRPKREVQLTPRQRLERAIADDPTNVENYIKLADLLLAEGRHSHALNVLNKALAASGKHPRVLALLEEAQLHHLREQVAIAEKQVTLAQESEKESAVALVKRLKADLLRRELAVYTRRCDENPQNLELHYELGVRLKRVGNFDEAIRSLKKALDEPEFEAPALIEMGECLQHRSKYAEALDAYQRAAAVAREMLQPDEQKHALYRAGVLATGMRQLDEAERLLLALKKVDPGYRDLDARLDKIAKIRQNA